MFSLQRADLKDLMKVASRADRWKGEQLLEAIVIKKLIISPSADINSVYHLKNVHQ